MFFSVSCNYSIYEDKRKKNVKQKIHKIDVSGDSKIQDGAGNVYNVLEIVEQDDDAYSGIVSVKMECTVGDHVGKIQTVSYKTLIEMSRSGKCWLIY